MDQITRPIVREPQAKILRPRPISSIKGQQKATYEPEWWRNLKATFGGTK